ncbi:hypothetical protein [Catellatospora tritici]|uniref:hypothetical protein n=1 Tax=Catellatospora tritici TaxID=2851566 RepID=UPI001C2DBC13|nr:hypothetical protein [Catellatospora tritici]MBV1853897.1 hypothetical protein [Catellatospora tritici]
MEERGFWRRRWPAIRRPALVIALLGLVSGPLGAVPAVDLAMVHAPMPGAVCPLLRAELLDLLVPGRADLRDGTEPLDPKRPFSVAWCYVSTSKNDATETGAVRLSVTVVAYGRRGWDGPVALAENYLSHAGFVGERRYAVPELGPGAHFWFGNDGTVYVQARLGGRGVGAEYFNLGIPVERRVEAAVLAAREVRAAL